jgi:hypothetical protein
MGGSGGPFGGKPASVFPPPDAPVHPWQGTLDLAIERYQSAFVA